MYRFLPFLDAALPDVTERSGFGPIIAVILVVVAVIAIVIVHHEAKKSRNDY